MSNLTCVVCGAPLTGGSDTFGDIHNPMCQADHLAMWAETEIALAEEKKELAAKERRRQELTEEINRLRWRIDTAEDELEAHRRMLKELDT